MLRRRSREAFVAYFGDKHGQMDTAASGSEDFQNLAAAVGRPSVFWGWSGSDPKVWAKYQNEGTLGQLPVNHS